ncbi:hypothetical protein IV203_025937 [Nitzschia inconspicua]|uniref:Uncharacterized protein n=1 Tax=Nitzschia inconspicua TaxID=303405 RepID=A0A9K3P853_9STRA|nr:hypothetical protein IV203_017750 [Nitzschia inconspicua]KAG7362271.1 hypothetical protein IV203_025937 [Nitzschia inconspicua]
MSPRNKLSSLFIILLSRVVASFAPVSFPARFQSSLAYSIHDEDKPILCYLITTTDDDNGGIPQVICTSNPEEYAWYHGIDKEQMVLTDGIHDHALQCVKGESPRGIPEWECESAFQ